MRGKGIPVLLAACVLLSACGQSRSNKTVIDITETVKEYETMPYEKFKGQTGNEAEFYHGDRFIGEIPDSSLSVIYIGKYSEDVTAAVLTDGDMPIRIQGPLGVLMDGIKEEQPLTEFVEALPGNDATKAVYELLEGGGTAYYIGNEYVRIQFDGDKDGEYDRLLLISLDESVRKTETVGPESIAWLELL